MTVVSFDHLSLTEVRRACRVLQEADGHCTLDLQALSTGSDDRDRAKRLPIVPLLVLSNILLTGYADRDLTVRLPTSPSLRRQLTRSGIYYSLAQHPKARINPEGEISAQAWQAWKTDWRVSDVAFRHRLFSLEDDLPDVEIQDGLATYINPHRSGSPDIEKHLAYESIRPWLTRLLRGADRALSSDQAILIESVTGAVTELLENIRHHAALSGAANSFVQLDVTKGSNACIYITVFDTGLGIPHTSRQRWSSLWNQHDRQPAHHLIQAALAGSLPRHGRDRATGLSSVRNAVERQGGDLIVLSHSAGEQCQAATLIEVGYADKAYTFDSHPDFPFHGTIVRAGFRLGLISEQSHFQRKRQVALPVS